MKSLTEPGAGKSEKEARIKAHLPPKEGEIIDGKKVTAATRKKTKDTLRETRYKGWLGGRS